MKTIGELFTWVDDYCGEHALMEFLGSQEEIQMVNEAEKLHDVIEKELGKHKIHVDSIRNIEDSKISNPIPKSFFVNYFAKGNIARKRIGEMFFTYLDF